MWYIFLVFLNDLMAAVLKLHSYAVKSKRAYTEI